MKHIFLSFYWLLSIVGFGADVVTVTSGTAGNAGSTAAELVNFIDMQMLDVAETNTYLKQLGDPRPLPKGVGSKVIQFDRFEKLTVAASPTQLTEGVSPDAVGITINQYTATTEQYGNLVRLSELAEITAKHPLVQQAINRLGLWGAEVYDVLIYNVLDAATSIYRTNSRAGDTSLLASDVLSYNDLVSLNALLAAQAAQTFGDGQYAYVNSPQPIASLQKDPDWKAANQFGNADKIFRGQIGSLSNLAVVSSNSPAFATTAQTTSGYANKVYSGFACGKGAFQVSDLQSMESIVTPPGGHGDPLKQSTKIGIKFSMKSVISNQNWIQRHRSAGNNSTTY